MKNEFHYLTSNNCSLKVVLVLNMYITCNRYNTKITIHNILEKKNIYRHLLYYIIRKSICIKNISIKNANVGIIFQL